MDLKRWPVLVVMWCVAAVYQPGCGTPGPDGPADSYGLNFTMPPGSQTRGAIIFLVDGVNAEIFQRMLEAGELPAFKKYFVDRGLYAPRAVANIPSITLVNLTSVITGDLPGHTGIIGNNWFDRNQLIWRNYDTIKQKDMLDEDYIVPNAYEYFPQRLTYSIFYQPHRGATKYVENWRSAGPPFYFGWYEFVDRLTLSRLNLLTQTAREYKQFPAITMVYLLAADFRAYRHGVGSEEYRAALKHTDRQIGRVLGDVQRAGLLDKLVIGVVSDHGFLPVTRHLFMENCLREDAGLNVGVRHYWESNPFEERLEDYRKVSAVFYGSGDKYAAICLRRPIRRNGQVDGFEPWLTRPTVDDLKSYPTRLGLTNLPDALMRQEAVDVLAYPLGPQSVLVRTKKGEVEFSQPGGQGGMISCRVVSGSDPLGYRPAVSDAALAGQPMPPREWFKATATTDYPDLPEQILAYFRSPRAGDIAVFAAPGWDFNRVHKSGHGGVRAGDMMVPILLAGPGVPHARLETVRTIDLMPTVLSLLGEPVPPEMDGRPFVKAATQPTTQPVIRPAVAGVAK